MKAPTHSALEIVGLDNPDPWADLESRSPLRVPRNYPIVV